ncbi:MAG: 30S ribosomal protein S21 [Chloroflexia bacterium]|nr:30S ribosomal protein S21 [Chloroflexia bacterium]
MTTVVRRSDEGLERMLKRFRRKMQESGQLRDYRRKRYFISKGEARRDKMRRAERRRHRRLLRQQRRESRGRRRGR